MKLNFRIIEEEVDRLKRTTIEEFDKFGNIDTQFLFQINNIIYGVVHNDIPFGQELLITWLERLNNVVKEILNNKETIVFSVPDINQWIYIRVFKEKLAVNILLPREYKYINKEINSLDDIRIIRSIEYVIADYFDEKTFVMLDEETDVEKNEFINSVLIITARLIDEITLINKKLIKSKTIINLQKLYNLNLKLYNI